MYNIAFINGNIKENSTLLTKHLTSIGYDMKILGEKDDFIAVLHKDEPDLVIVDLSGKNNENNFAKLLKIRNDDKTVEIPILALTDDSDIAINRATLAGADEYIVRPIRKTDLTRIGILINKYNQYSFKPGTIVFSKYKILSILGQGASSTVYKALEIHSNMQNKLVALKVIKHNSNYKTLLKEFNRETLTLSKLSHKNIVKLIDCGCYESIFFIAVEFVQGRDLQSIVEEHVLNENKVLKIAVDLVEALQYINSFNMLHRDIKAENIIISNDGNPVIIDLGLMDFEKNQPYWVASEINGTPLYLSPEYIDGKEISIKSDLYALGITLFYALSGTFPFNARSPMAILAKHLNENPPLLCEIVPSVSKTFSDIISKILKKNPRERISLKELSIELKKLHDQQLRN